MSRRGRLRETVLRFDSRYRTSGSNNAPIFSLEQRLTNVTMVELRKIVYPNTDYPIHSLNNTFLFTDTLGVDVTATLPVGSYTITELAIEIELAMNAAETGAVTYTVNPDENTGKLTITASSGDFTMLSGEALRIMGIENGQASSASILVGVKTFDASGENYILLRSVELVNGSTDFSHFSGSNNSSTNTTNVLEVLYKTSNFGTSILTDYNTKLRQPYHGILGSVQFEFSYPDGSLVDLNGAPFLVEMRVRHMR